MRRLYSSLIRCTLPAALGLLTLGAQAQTSCLAPQNLSVSALTATAATVSFQLPAGTSISCPFMMSYSYVGGPTTTITFLGYTARLSNLVPNQQYSLSVTRRCAIGISGCSSLLGAAAYISFTTASVLAAQVATTAGTPTLAPNPAPAGDRTTLTLAGPLPQPLLVAVLDALGRVVRQAVVPAAACSVELDLAGLSAGVYVVRYGSSAQRLVVK